MRMLFMRSLFVIIVLSLAAGVSLDAQGPPPSKGPGSGGGGGGGGADPPAEADHTALWPTPVPPGTSAGSVIDQANGFCSTGTLGALMVDSSGKHYVLSNSHVFAGDVEDGGNLVTATSGGYATGDNIIQPGLADIGCLPGYSEGTTANTIGDLASASSIWPTGLYNVDAAVAEVRLDASSNPLVKAEILEIGFVSSTVRPDGPDLVGLKVQKSGRTTGLSKSTIDGVNATINVGYSKEVAGTSFTKQFTGQIVVRNRGKKFLDSGDSGSLLVENDNDGDIKAVGLLFAGGNTIGVANPIEDVLTYFSTLGFNLSFVSGGAAAASTSSGGQVTGVGRAIQVQEANADFLATVPGSVGHAVGAQNGIGVIKVYVESITPLTRQAVPNQLDGVPVVLEAVGEIVAF